MPIESNGNMKRITIVIVYISIKPHLLSVYCRNKLLESCLENIRKAVKLQAVDKSTQIGGLCKNKRNDNYVIFLDKTIPAFVSR